MNWDSSEKHELRELIAHIDEFRGFRCASPPKGTLCLKLSDAEELKAHLTDRSGGALLVRHLLRSLKFNEQRLFNFRFEHKLVQAHILHHYCPGAMPMTIGARRAMCGLTLDDATRRLSHAYEDGYIVKACLGDGSGESGQVNQRPHISSVLLDQREAVSTGSLLDELYIFQERVEVVHEYRVHSIEDFVIPDLTYSRYLPGATDARALQIPNLFVQEVLNCLPNGLIRDSLYGWDIAIDNHGIPIVLEVNSTGVHPVFRPGFQCSGFFLTSAMSVMCLARLIAFVGRMYEVSIDLDMPATDTDEFATIYRLVGMYQTFQRIITGVNPKLPRRHDFTVYPDCISNSHSVEMNTLLWAFAETLSLEKALGVTPPAGSEHDVIDEKPHYSFSHQEHESFFQKMLGDLDEVTAPFGLQAIEGDWAPTEEAHLELDGCFLQRLREAARAIGVGEEALYHLAFARVLARVSGREDVVFGTMLYGRMQAGSSSGVRPFSNMLPLRIRGEDESVQKALMSTQELLVALKRHKRCSQSLAQRCSALPAQTQPFAALLNYRRNRQSIESTFDDTREAPLRGQTIYPLELTVDDGEDRVLLTTRVRPPIESVRLCDYVRTALTSLVKALEEAPTTSIRHVDILPSLELRKLIYDWNNTSVLFNSDVCIHQLFEEQAHEHPDAVAVEYEGSELSYAELNRRANRLAHHLNQVGIRPQARVAICMERGFEMIVALLGVLKAGGAYVPLDPAYPAERLRFMLEDAQPMALLTQTHLHKLFVRITDALITLDIDTSGSTWQNQSEDNLDRNNTGLASHDPAYIIYTSGSTGVPKGVQVSHSSLSNFLWSMQRVLPVDAGDVFLALTTICFDIAALELYLPLTLGARAKIVGRDVTLNTSRLIGEIENGTTIVQATPTTWKMLIDAGWQGKPGLKVLSGGEALSVDLAGKIVSRCNLAWNMYGPTETTIWSMMHKLEAGQDRVAIGRPIANTRIYILGARGEPVPVGVAGELYIGGAGVADGYLHQVEQTRLRFLVDPYLAKDEERIYKTGDLVRYQQDGTVEFLGRNDSQVKIRGFRIELGEIEARLAECPGVRQAVVIVREDTPGDKLLVAYYTKSEKSALGEFAFASETLHAQLASILPDYMIPARFIGIDSMPLTPNGKINRQALPAPNEREKRPPHVFLSTTETTLLTLWRDLFNDQGVRINNTFLSLGGHSVLAVRLVNQVRSRFSVDVPLEWLFTEDACVRELARAIDDLYRTEACQSRLS